MKTKDKLLKIYRADKIYLAEWILAIVTGMFVFITSSTWDLQSLTIWSTNVLDVIYEGKFRDLYEYTANNIYGVHQQSDLHRLGNALGRAHSGRRRYLV